jgi:hypothetical protein
MRPPSNAELPVIQHSYDLILWYVPILNRLPSVSRFALGDRLIAGLYDLAEQLIAARYPPAPPRTISYTVPGIPPEFRQALGPEQPGCGNQRLPRLSCDEPIET